MATKSGLSAEQLDTLVAWLKREIPTGRLDVVNMLAAVTEEQRERLLDTYENLKLVG